MPADRYNQTAKRRSSTGDDASLAVSADTDHRFRPQQFSTALWNCRVDFRFPMVKRLDDAEPEPERWAWPRSDARPPNGTSWCKAGRAAARHKPTTEDATASP